MKNNLYPILFCLIMMTSYGQVGSVGITHYALPEFTVGEILMNNGQNIRALLNYNILSEKMIFEENGKKLAITETQLNQIDTVFIKNRKFCRKEDKFLELLYFSKSALYAEYKCRLEAPGTANGYGGSSQTSSSSSFSSIEDRGIQYELSLPDGYKAKPYTIYWLKTNAKMSSFKNMKQLMKLYGNKKDLIKTYKKTHDVDYNNQESIIKLVAFLDTN